MRCRSCNACPAALDGSTQIAAQIYHTPIAFIYRLGTIGAIDWVLRQLNARQIVALQRFSRQIITLLELQRKALRELGL